jgi:hypothetical protein
MALSLRALFKFASKVTWILLIVVLLGRRVLLLSATFICADDTEPDATRTSRHAGL